MVPRLFRNHPGYVTMSTLVLAVAIGINLFVFTVVNALWIRPLPFAQPDRVVTVLAESAGVGTLDSPELKIFEGGVAGQFVTTDTFDALRPRIQLAGDSRIPEALGVTSGYFKVLGVPIRGRDFTTADEQVGAEAVAILSDDIWSRAFGRRTDVIGAVVASTPLTLRVIGVAPPRFEGARRGEQAEMWIPAALMRRLAPADWLANTPPMMVFARLGPGQTAAATEQRYHELMDPRRRAMLTGFKVALPRVIPLTEVFGTSGSRTIAVREGNAFLVVSGLAMLVLLAGCATIAALVLVHYERRRGELGIKMSLGAARHRLVFELARDLSWIAALGVAGGIGVATLGVRVVPALSLPSGVDIGRLDLSIDWRVVAVAVATAALTMLIAATLPLRRATRLRVAGELLAGPSGTTLSSLRTRQALLALQVSATIIVLVAAGLFVRAVAHGFGNAAGFDIDRTAFVSIQEGTPFAGGTGRDPRSLIAKRANRFIPVLAALPGVDDVAEGLSPIGPTATAMLARPRTIKLRDRQVDVFAGVMAGSPNLLPVLGVPILAGRGLSPADAGVMPQPVVITSSLAQRVWPGGSALDETFTFPLVRGGPYLVVGIARDLAFGSLTRPVTDVVVTVGSGNSAIVSSFVVRSDQPRVVSGVVQQTIAAQVVRVTTGRDAISADIGRQRLGAWFFSGFGLAALLLGVGGAFGLVAYLAESQQRECGIRLALGATLPDLVRHGLFAAIMPVSVGVVVGLAAGALASRLFASVLTGISSLDVVTYLIVAALMLGCASAAALAAAWRLRHTNPADALRAT